MSATKQWFEIEPIEIETPNGTQVVSKLHFNGYEPTLHMLFENDIGQTYELDCTFNHPLRTVDGMWIEAESIEPHHKFDGNYSLVYSLVNEDEIPTFDFEVPEEHCYLLESGIVSHNTASFMGGISEGINPMIGNAFIAALAGGEVDRVNPPFLKLLKERGKFTKKVIDDIVMKNGSVQHLDWLSDEEKAIYKTAFEIDQRAILRLASQRQRFIDQSQSLNLFFNANEDEAYISQIFKEAVKDPRIQSLYYMYSIAGVQASKDTCVACQ